MEWDARIGRRLRLRDLHILLAVVQAGSMARAAANLAVSQPAVWKAISDLECAVGLRLLDRSPRGVEPTRYGEALVKRAATVFDELRQGVKELDSLADPNIGELRIGTSEPIAGVATARIIERVSRKYPRVIFHVDSGDTALIYQKLRDREVDLIVVRVRGNEEDTDTHILHDDTFVVAAGTRNPWVKRGRIRLADLLGEPWILPPLDSWSGILIREAFAACKLALPQATVFTFSNALRNNLAASGRFLTVVPDYLMTSPAKHPGLTALPVRLEATRRQIGIVTLKKRTLSPVAEVFVACGRELAQELRKRR